MPAEKTGIVDCAVCHRKVPLNLLLICQPCWQVFCDVLARVVTYGWPTCSRRPWMVDG